MTAPLPDQLRRATDAIGRGTRRDDDQAPAPDEGGPLVAAMSPYQGEWFGAMLHGAADYLADDVMGCGCSSGSCYCDGDTPPTVAKAAAAIAAFACEIDESGGAMVCAGSVDCYAVGYHGLSGWVSIPEWGDEAILCPQCAGDCLVIPNGSPHAAGTNRLLRDIAWAGRLQKGGTA